VVGRRLIDWYTQPAMARAAAGCHRGRGGWMWYGLHLTDVTSSGVFNQRHTCPACVGFFVLR
jgi:hypothetical protein